MIFCTSAAASTQRSQGTSLQNATTLRAKATDSVTLTQRLRSLFEFRYFALFVVLATYGLIVLGGTVRVTDSGTACPDWPLCHGQVIPPADTKVWIEFTHRLVASVIGFLILGVVYWIWRNERRNRLLMRTGIFAVALLAVQIIVGGITVGTETAAGVVAIHLTIALALFSALILIAVAGQDPARMTARKVRGAAGRMPVLVGATLAGLFALIIVGAFVSQMEAGLAYPDWPLFDGGVTPSSSESGHIHYAHRLLASVVGVLLVWLAVRVVRTETSAAVLGAMGIVILLFAAQVLLGAANIWFDLATSVRILHLALASALWGVLVFALMWSHARSGEAGS